MAHLGNTLNAPHEKLRVVHQPGEHGFGVGPVIGFALIAGIIYLLFRKGYVPEEGGRSLTSVDAAMAR